MKNAHVVIDTNVWISSFYGGNPRKIIDIWKKQKIVLCLSSPIVEEYIEIFQRLKVDQSEVYKIIQLFKEGYSSKFIAHTPDISFIDEDPDDDVFIEAAVAHNAQYIVSGDKHLLHKKAYFDIQILSPREFIDLY